MNRLWRAALLTLGLGVLLLAAAVAAYLIWGAATQLSISVDGHPIATDRLHAGHWAATTLGLVIAGAVLLLVVTVALVFGLGLPLLIGAMALALGLLAAGAVMLAVLSPLLLIGWLLWRALRPNRPKPAQAGDNRAS